MVFSQAKKGVDATKVEEEGGEEDLGEWIIENGFVTCNTTTKLENNAPNLHSHTTIINPLKRLIFKKA